MRRSLAVAFDKGAAPLEIHRGLESFADVTYFVTDSPEARRARPVLETLGPTVDIRSAADAVVAHRSFPFDGVVTYSERLVRLTAEITASLGLRGHSVHAARLLTDKPAQRRRLADAGVSTLRFLRIDAVEQWRDAVAVVGLPAVVKPAVGEGSRNTFLIEDEEQGAALVRHLLDGAADSAEPVLIVEEYLVGTEHHPFADYVSVETAVSDGRIDNFMVSGKFPLMPPFRELGAFWPTHLPDVERKAVEDVVTAALTALGAGTGIVHSEVKMTADGPQIIEINGRLGGDMNDLGLRSGVGDLVALGGRLALGEPAQLGVLEEGKVFFQYSTPAPAESSRLIAVEGAAQVRKMPGVQRYHLFFRPGDELGRGVHWRPMDMVCGVADGHQDMIRMVEAVRATLTFVIEQEGSERAMSAAAMTGWTY